MVGFAASIEKIPANGDDDEDDRECDLHRCDKSDQREREDRADDWRNRVQRHAEVDRSPQVGLQEDDQREVHQRANDWVQHAGSLHCDRRTIQYREVDLEQAARSCGFLRSLKLTGATVHALIDCIAVNVLR